MAVLVIILVVLDLKGVKKFQDIRMIDEFVLHLGRVKCKWEKVSESIYFP